MRKRKRTELVVGPSKVVFHLRGPKPKLGIVRQNRKTLDNRMIPIVHLAVGRATEACDTAHQAQERVVGLQGQRPEQIPCVNTGYLPIAGW